MIPEWGTSRPRVSVFDPAVEHLAVVVPRGRPAVGLLARTTVLRKMAIVGAATLAMLSLGACRPDNRAHVVVIGDSLTHNALGALYTELSNPAPGAIRRYR